MRTGSSATVPPKRGLRERRNGLLLAARESESGKTEAARARTRRRAMASDDGCEGLYAELAHDIEDAKAPPLPRIGSPDLRRRHEASRQTGA